MEYLDNCVDQLQKIVDSFPKDGSYHDLEEDHQIADGIIVECLDSLANEYANEKIKEKIRKIIELYTSIDKWYS